MSKNFETAIAKGVYLASVLGIYAHRNVCVIEGSYQHRIKMTSNTIFIVASWFPRNVCVKSYFNSQCSNCLGN